MRLLVLLLLVAACGGGASHDYSGCAPSCAAALKGCPGYPNAEGCESFCQQDVDQLESQRAECGTLYRDFLACNATATDFDCSTAPVVAKTCAAAWKAVTDNCVYPGGA